MTDVRERLRRAIDRQRRLVSKPQTAPEGAAAMAAMRPVYEAAVELRDELSDVPDLRFEIAPTSVEIELYDKHLWFSYDPDARAFVGIEQDTKWMEGGLREAPLRWETAEACIEAMVQACARYLMLAEALTKLRPGP